MRALYLCLALFCCGGCQLTSELNDKLTSPAEADLRVTYGKGPCYGSCPIFELDVYADGALVYKGKRFTDRAGEWRKRGDRREITSFLDELNAIDWDNYPEIFPSRIPDMATTTITWYDGAQVPRTVKFKEETSPELRAVAKLLEQFANEGGYRQVSETVDGQAAVASGDREEIIVLLKEGEDAGAWVGKYAKQRVALKERIQPNGNYYLITADPNVMSATELLKWLRQDEAVLSAQLNGAAGPR